MTADASVDIKGLRQARRLSQQQLAVAAGCSLSMLRMLESGYRPDSSGVLDRVLFTLRSELTPPAPTDPESGEAPNPLRMSESWVR